MMLAALGLTLSCSKKPETSSTPPSTRPANTNQQVFVVKGVVIALRPGRKEIEIRHETVPGYMPAMTMPFDVKDTNDLAGLQAGDPVSFRLTATDTEAWIDQIHKLGPATTNNLPTTGPFRLVREVRRLEVGDPLPEFHLTNQLGEAFSTARYKGQALALTFLFTRCPYPTFCPRMANNFQEAQQTLLMRTNGPANWQLLTVSFDPEFDHPEVLQTYARFHRYDPAHWTFATGALIDITALGEQFGLTFWHDETGSISHNLRTVVFDPSGKVTRIFEGNDWTSADLVAELASAMAK